jgi:acetyltransferase-like isoleucine patch superfamily enzyme
MPDISFFIRRIKYFIISLKYNSLRGYKVGKYFMVGKQVNISKKGFYAGDCVYIGQYSYFGPNVKIGNFCIMADQINIIGHDHEYKKVGNPIILSGRPKEDETIETIIEDDVWIGHGVTIMRGTRIGEGSIIAANSVVTKNIMPYTINAGIPAKQIGMRFKEEEMIKHKEFLLGYRMGRIKIKHDRKMI